MRDIPIFISLRVIPFKLCIQNHILYNKSWLSINKTRVLSCILKSSAVALGTTERLYENTRKTLKVLEHIQYISDFSNDTLYNSFVLTENPYFAIDTFATAAADQASCLKVPEKEKFQCD